ncbi:MAG: hypothetical protein Q9190_003855 [Brigantiaea leucoxantha]
MLGEENTNQLARNQGIWWTVEWVHRNGTRSTGTCPESVPVGEAYAAHMKKKKFGLEEDSAHLRETQIKRRKLSDQSSQTKPQGLSASLGQSQPDSKDQSVTPLGLAENGSSDQAQPSAKPSEHSNHQAVAHFYLLLPSTPTSYRVLTPIDPTDSLSTVLTDRLVLEYPTIYALKQPPDKLPTGFVTEEHYLGNMASTEQNSLLKNIDALREDAQDEKEEGEVDEKALLSVLKKDLISEV